MKYVGIVEDKWVTPYLEITYYEKYKYIEFPFDYENVYQKTRFYSKQNLLLTKQEFVSMCNPPKSEGI